MDLVKKLRGLDIDDVIDEKYSIRTGKKSKLYLRIKQEMPDLSDDSYINGLNHVINGLEDSIFDAKEPEKVTNSETPQTKVLKFRARFNTSGLELETVFKSLKLDENLVAKTFHGYPVEYTQELSDKINKTVRTYLYSEHKIGSLKKLEKDVVSCLYYTSKFTITCSLSDTGVISMTIEPTELVVIEDVSVHVKKLYTDLTKNQSPEPEYTDIDVKIVYPTHFGYLTKETISELEKVPVVNNIVKFKYMSVPLWYSNSDSKLNFTSHSIKAFKDVKKVEETVTKKVEYYMNNLTKVKITPQGEDILYVAPEKKMYLDKPDSFIKIFNSGVLDGTHKIVSIRTNGVQIKNSAGIQLALHGNYIFSSVIAKRKIKEKRNLGLVVDSIQCEKKRRPILSDDTTTPGELLEINGANFKCNKDYPYHGYVGKTNCCFKRPKVTTRLSESNVETIDNQKIRFKKTALKKFTNVKKFSPIKLDNTLSEYFNEDYILMSGADEPEDRTILSCLTIAFGEGINSAINEMTNANYKKYLKYSMTLEQWKNTENKSIDDTMVAVSLYTKVNIIVIHYNFIVRCNNMFDFDKNLVIYRNGDKQGTYYLVVNAADDYSYQHQNVKIKELLDDYTKTCNIEQTKGVNYYRDVIKTQITDYQNLVVFGELKIGGYVCVAPSTIQADIPVVSVNSPNFRLLTPEAQYKNLVEISKIYPQFEPVGVTRGSVTKLVTGIKTLDGQITPVSNSNWEQNYIPSVEDLFYIERYSGSTDVYEDEEQKFSAALEKVKSIDTQLLVKNEEYQKLIEILKPVIQDETTLSKAVWYLINNQA